jgi:hypothetical protein
VLDKQGERGIVKTRKREQNFECEIKCFDSVSALDRLRVEMPAAFPAYIRVSVHRRDSPRMVQTLLANPLHP